MDEATKKTCLVVLNRLRKRQALQDFRMNKRELIGIQGYIVRVEHPIDFKEVEEAVKSGRAATPEAFARLMRRMAGNCLRFCVDANLSLRGTARKLLEGIDEETGKELPGQVRPLDGDAFRCLRVLDQVLSPLLKAGKPVGFFSARLEQSLASNPALAADYAKEVAFPMDLGRLTTELLEEGIAAPEFLAKAELVFRNCLRFWGPRGDAGMVALANDFLAALEREAQATLPAAWAGRALPPLPPAGPVPPGKAALLQSLGMAAPAPAPGPAVVGPPPVALPKLAAAAGPVHGSGGAAPQLKLKQVVPSRGESAAPGRAAGAGVRDVPKFLPRASTLPSSSPSSSSAAGGTGGLKLVIKKPSAGGGGAPQLKKTLSLNAASSSFSSAQASAAAGAAAAPVPTLKLPIKPAGPAPSSGARDATAVAAASTVLRPSPSTVGTAAELADEDASRASLPSRSSTPVAPLPSPTAANAAAIISQRATAPSAAATVPRLSLPLPARAPSLQGASAPLPYVLKPQPSVGVFEEQPLRQETRKEERKEKSEAAAGAAGGTVPRLKLKPLSQADGPAAAASPVKREEELRAVEGDGTQGPVLKGRKRERSSLSPKQPASGRGGKKKGKAGGAGAGAAGAPRKSGGGMADLEGWERQCWLFADELLVHVKALGAPAQKKSAKGPMENRYDFEKPVLVLYPYLAEEYLRKVGTPMDFSTCKERLREHRYAGPRAFLEDVDRIFANAIAFNAGSPDPYQQELVLVARHLRKYLDLLALEMLPLDEEYADAPLNLSARRRDERRAALAQRAGQQLAAPQDPYRPCYNEMRDLVKECRRADPKVYFNEPVSKVDNPQYYVRVARPVCFKDVMRSMEAGSASVAQVVADLRLIVQNALFYNEPTSEISETARDICNAARRMSAKLDQELPAVYLRIWKHLEREAELKEPLKKLAHEGERQHNQFVQQQQQQQQEEEEAAAAAAADGAVTEKEEGEQKPAVARAGGKGAGLRATGLPPRAPLVPSQGVGGGAAGPAAAAARLKKEKKREVDQDRRQEDKKRRERETKMKECILGAVRARLERGQERLGQLQEKEKEEEEQIAAAAAAAAAAAGDAPMIVEDEQDRGGEGALGGSVSIGRIDLSGVGRRRAEQEAGGAGGARFGPPVRTRRLLSDLLTSSMEEEHGEDVDGGKVKELETQLVPPALLDPMDVATEDGSTGGGSGGSSEEDSDDGEEDEDSDHGKRDGRGPLHVRLGVRVVDPPAWDPTEEWEAGVAAYAFPQAPLVHLTIAADDDPSLWTLPRAPLAEEEPQEAPTPRGGNSRRRSRRLQSLADEGSTQPNGRPPVVVEVDGGQRWVVPALKADDELEEMETDTRPRKRRCGAKGAEGRDEEHQRQHAVASPPLLGPGEKALALLRLSGMDVQLVLPPAAHGDSSRLPLSTVLRQAKLWCRGLLPTGGPASRFHERMARAYYAWLGPLALLPLGEDDDDDGPLPPLLLSPEPVREDLKEQGRVRVLHLVAPVGVVEVWVAGRRVRHPAFLQAKHQGAHRSQPAAAEQG